jgi:hypothetical protein
VVLLSQVAMNRQAVEGAFHMMLAPAAAADRKAQRRVRSGTASAGEYAQQAVNSAFNMLLAPAPWKRNSHKSEAKVILVGAGW